MESLTRPDAPQAGDVVFLPEDTEPSTSPRESCAWRVLAVDDDPAFQRATSFALSGMRVLGRPIELLQAYSHAEAARLLAAERDIAVMLLDVVMETDDAGLRLARAVREVLGNAELRIVLVTGQPGLAPVREVMEQYDINDYWSKPELGVERLHTLLTANTRAWEQLRTVARARRGLQLIVEATNVLVGARNLRDFSARTIAELASVLGVPPEGLVCVHRTRDDAPDEGTVIGAAGQFASAIGQSLDLLQQEGPRAAIRRCLTDRHTRIEADCMVLYFPAELAGDEYAAWVQIERPLDETEQELLRVFALNIGSGLHNVALVSRLDELAYRDSLLALPNRNALLRALEAALDSANGRDSALLLIDIDDFSGINLALGPHYGDQLLKRVAARLRQTLDPTVLLARLGSDTFAVFGSRALIDIHAISAALGAGTEAGAVDCTVGTALLPLAQFNGSAADALTSARLLLKQAKQRGCSQHLAWLPELQAAAGRRFELLQALREALTQGAIGIELQPQVELESGMVVGVEALARWHLADGSTIPPDAFIPLAEATGLIVPLGEHVLRLSCEAAARLCAAGFAHVRVAVNVSGVQMERMDVVASIERQLAATGISARQLEVEVTESTAMEGFMAVRDVLDRLRRLGVSVAIDDFGTGFSSLAHLRRLPTDLLKIDRSFIQEIDLGASRSALADLVIRLAGRLDLKTIAEGIETREQAEWLRDHGCELGQGWLFARSLPLDVLLEWLQAHGGRVEV